MKPTADLEKTTCMLKERIERLLQSRRLTDPKKRIIIALAGVPGSGKSTVSDTLLRALPKHGITDVAVLPMDGFHHTKASLSGFDDPELAFRRRGAPFTFDAESLVELIARLKSIPVTECDEPETIIHAPSFDHAVGDPVPGAIAISSECRVVIVEGNYTLLDEQPWSQIPDIVDEKWFVDVQPGVARDRLARRHLQAGIERTMESAILRAEDNDLPNGDLIRCKLVNPDVHIIN